LAICLLQKKGAYFSDEAACVDNRFPDARPDCFGRSLSRKQNGQVSPKVNDYRNVEPFRGSEVGNTLARACGDCHSNQTSLPWYGHVAPISWWIKSHVCEGREELNFSEWTRYSARQRRDELESICGVISNGRMPPRHTPLYIPKRD
jgi:Haem-binding domain